MRSANTPSSATSPPGTTLPTATRTTTPETPLTAWDTKLAQAIKQGNAAKAAEALRGAPRGGPAADPNASFPDGSTPLTLACQHSNNRLHLVRLLIDQHGADPTVPERSMGYSALHVAAVTNSTNLVTYLVSRAPSTLNLYADRGETPLLLACAQGHEAMVSRLLRAGARQRLPPDPRGMCPLGAALKEGHSGVVRLLIGDSGTNPGVGGSSGMGLGLDAIGGSIMIPNAMYGAVRFGRVAELRLLLALARDSGERAEWLRAPFSFPEHRRLLHFAAGFCCPKAVDVLLRAGASEMLADSIGRVPGDDIGVDARTNGRSRDRGKEVAVSRMLERGTAYRARSWAWGCYEGAGGGGGGCSVVWKRRRGEGMGVNKRSSEAGAAGRWWCGPKVSAVVRLRLSRQEFAGIVHRYGGALTRTREVFFFIEQLRWFCGEEHLRVQSGKRGRLSPGVWLYKGSCTTITTERKWKKKYELDPDVDDDFSASDSALSRACARRSTGRLVTITHLAAPPSGATSPPRIRPLLFRSQQSSLPETDG